MFSGKRQIVPAFAAWYRFRSSAPVSATALAFLAASILLLLLLSPGRAAAQNGVVIGTVKDSAGTPLSNVQVSVSGQRSALSNDHGQFVLRALSVGTHHLDLVRLGYASSHEVVTISSSNDEVRINVVMALAAVRLSSVNVTATPTGSDPLALTQATTQLSGKDLQRAMTASIGQSLAKEPGMSARFNGPIASAPVIRGLTGERVLVLQDGDRTGDLSSAAADHMNAIDPSSAERVEVIRGPASLLYGNNSMGGVVNVISSDIPSSIPTHFTGYLMGQGESATSGAVGGLGATIPMGDYFAMTVRGSLRNVEDLRVGGGYRQPNTDGNTSQASAGASYVGTRLMLGAVYRQMDFAYGLPYDFDAEAVRIEGMQRAGVLQASYNTPYNLISSIKLDQTVQGYHHSELEDDGEVGTRFNQNTQTTNLVARTALGRSKGALGVQGVFRQYTPSGEEAFTPAADNNNLAAFIFQEYALTDHSDSEQSLNLQVGVRYDHFTLLTRPGEDVDRFGASRTRHLDNVAASLGLSIPIATGMAVSANWSRGFRAPSVEELFANGFHAAMGTYDIGNPDLNAEQSTGVEIGMRAERPGFSAQISTYRNSINDYITPIAMSDAVTVDDVEVQTVTFEGRNAIMLGVEGQVEARLPHSLVGGLMGDFTRASIRGDRTGVLPYMPAARLGGSLRFDNGHLSAGGDLRRVFAQNRVLNDGYDIPTDAYTQLDLHASRMFSIAGRRVHSVTLRVDNALDARYRDATSRIKRFALNPGRNASVVYKYMF